jgi:hypothetical protein
VQKAYEGAWSLRVREAAGGIKTHPLHFSRDAPEMANSAAAVLPCPCTHALDDSTQLTIGNDVQIDCLSVVCFAKREEMHALSPAEEGICTFQVAALLIQFSRTLRLCHTTVIND